MFANRYTALIDACTLVSVWRRNLLLSLAEAEFFRVRWSEPVLNETKAALLKMARERSFDDPEARGVRAVKAMQSACPEAMVEDFTLIGSAQFGLPDPGDEHVIAAAVKTQAQALVTENLKDFPADILGQLNIEARSADDFIADTIALEEGRAIAAIRKMRERLKRPEMSPEDFLRALEANGLLETASVITPHLGSI